MKQSIIKLKSLCKLSFGLFFAAILISPILAKAESSFEHIEKFHSDININQDGSVDVVEHILYDFGQTDHHGIIRDIPLFYSPGVDTGEPITWNFGSGINEVSPNIIIESITDQSGAIYEYQETRDSYLSVKIGDPDHTITGQHWYVISYSVSGIVAKQALGNELFWNVTGNGWSVPINEATATITVPAGTSSDTNYAFCFSGTLGSKEQDCSAEVVNDRTFSYTAHNLSYYSGLTVSAIIEGGLIPESQLFQPARITNYQVSASVQEDTSIHVIETIEIDLGQYSPGNLTRKLSQLYEEGEFQLPIAVNSITNAAGETLPSRDIENSGTHQLSISAGPSSNAVFSGLQKLVIDYTVEAAGSHIKGTSTDHVFLNVTGDSWPMTIEHADVELTLPSASQVENNSAECTLGNSILPVYCTATVVDEKTFAYSADYIAAGDSMTVAADFTTGIVTIPASLTVMATPFRHTDLTVTSEHGNAVSGTGIIHTRLAPGTYSISGKRWGYHDLQTSVVLETGSSKNVYLDLKMTLLNQLLTFVLPVVLALALSVALWWFWWKRGRDPKGRGTIIAQYEPPDNLDPGEVGVIHKSLAHKKDISAEIIQLAIRGYIKIKQGDKESSIKGLRGKYDYTFVKLKNGRKDPALKSYQEKIFTAIFPRDTTTEKKLSQLREKFYSHVPAINKDIYKSLTEAGYFPRRPDRARALWITAGIICALCIAGIFAGLGMVTENYYYFAGLVPTIEAFIVSLVMPKRTKAGALAAEHIEGFKRFLSTTEKARLDFHNAPATYKELFERYLPYAIVLGVENKWAAQFEGLFEDESVSWFDGTDHLSVIAITHAMSSFSSSASSTISSSPSSSGGSGGGFSGGGFGGGGGSSW
ncbi:MAG: hypothetical protein CO132_03200 [Candidatus Kerfeldbacteria bacterium CG_4_9_14_3_um_filter_45_8]|nr:MAG: hypothetical protein CO132_03200 [Candidatus Kerfeldbacteria bacterium CG_4_9_14_3_um_filter_45_8]